MMCYENDNQSKRFYYLLTIINVLLLVASELAYDQHDKWNEIYKLTNISRSEFKQNDVLNNEKIGLFIFTQYCGPGERIWKNIYGQGKLPSSNTYADIDVCCKRHDECPNYISSDSDYDKFNGLPKRPQLFARLGIFCKTSCS